MLGLQTKFLPNLLALLLAISLLGGCATGDSGIDWEALESAQETANARFKRRSLDAMPIETVYPDNGLRALAQSAKDGDIDRIETLIQSGQDVNGTGIFGVSALYWPLKRNMYWNDRESALRGVEKLLELGANPNLIHHNPHFTDGADSMIHYAARLGEDKFVRALLRHGGDPNLRIGTHQETPLFAAMRADRITGPNVVNVLLDAGADIDAQRQPKVEDNFDVGGETPIMKAFTYDHFELVLHLLNAGADYRIHDNRGETLLDQLAFRNSRLERSFRSDSWNKLNDWFRTRNIALPEARGL